MPPKKKLSKKEKARLEAEQAELLRIEMEKEKQKKLEEDRERKLQERREAEKRQKQEMVLNKVRRTQLKNSMEFFKQVEAVIKDIQLEEKRRREWDKYMRCNGLPSADCPGDLRKYMHMWVTTIKQRNTSERNWLLQTDERTLLTQDEDVPDLSRETLRKKQGNLGDSYARRVREVLGILREVDETLEDASLSASTRGDLKKLKMEIRTFLNDYIDEFTYRILSHIDRDMDIDRPGIYKHIYESDVFKCQVLTMQGDVQMNKETKIRSDEPKHALVEFPLLQLEMSLPPSVKLANSAVRGLWLSYDHFSDYCFSFEMPSSKRAHLNILLQTKKEWKKRKEILQATLEEAAKETPLTDVDTMELNEPRIIDVDKIYTRYEDERNKERKRTIGPEALNLSEFDVNLRKYRIISGVFCLNYLEQPQQDQRLSAGSFIRTITQPNKLTSKRFHQTYQPPPPPIPGVRRLPEEIEAEMKMVEANLDKLALLTLQLPDSVLWFEPPIVCRWETAEETAESLSVDTPATGEQCKSTISSRKSSRRRSSNKSGYQSLPTREMLDFDLTCIPRKIDIYGLVMDFVVPRLPFGYCVRLRQRRKQKTKDSFLYFTRFGLQTSSEGLATVDVKPICDYLEDTGSPREFFPKVTFKKILQIKRSDGDCSGAGYMFSQLVEDLDKLCETQSPDFEHRLNEINSALSSPRTEISPAASPQRRFSGIIILRESDVQKENAGGYVLEEEDSCSEYDEDEHGGNSGSSTDEDARNDSEAKSNIGKWSTRDVHDTKFNEDKLSIQFRSGRLGIFGFALNRYSNMPYQTWELKPDIKSPGSVVFSLTAAMVSLEITITAEGYCVNSFQGGTTDGLNAMLSKVMPMAEFKNILTTSAVDIFPDDDAFCYTEGSCEKNYVMEMHMYTCMAAIAQSHNFGWSRWNLLSGSRTAILLMREMLENKKVPTHSTLLVTPLSTTVIECTEVSASLNTIPAPGMEFYADLYQLVLAHSQPASKDKLRTMSPALRENIAHMLMSTRPVSFC